MVPGFKTPQTGLHCYSSRASAYIQDHRVQIIGPIRQEILSGIRSESQFKKLRRHLESFPDLPILTEDYVTAAQFFKRCRSNGILGSNTDFLICAVAVRNMFSIYTTDKDFEQFSKHIQIILHQADQFQQGDFT